MILKQQEGEDAIIRCPICKEGRIPSETDDELVCALVDLTRCRGSSGTLVDEDPSGSAAPAEAASANQDDSSGLAADGQEEGKGKDKGKGKAQLRPVGPSKVRAQTKLTPIPTD